MKNEWLIDNATSKHLFGHYGRIQVDMDFSRKLFHEIVVEREGYSFTVEVAYEWLPNFCSHCQNIGHDIAACRRLYPRKETTTPKEQIVMGKKQVPAEKVTWVPIKYNPSGIGSSVIFGSSKENDSEPINVDEETEVVPQQSMNSDVPFQKTIEAAPLEEETKNVPHPQHQSTNSDIPVQIPLEAASLEATLEMDVASQSQGDDNIYHTDDISAVTPTIMVTPISHSPAITNNTFSIQLENVSDEITRNDLEENQEQILSPIKEKTLDFGNIEAPNGALVDPVLQKDLDFMQTWLAKAAVNEVPFKEVVSKSQNKKKRILKGFIQNPLSRSSSSA